MDKRIFAAKNAWKRGVLPSEPALARPEFDHALDLLSFPQVVLVVGARRVGKTTLILETFRRLLTRAMAAPEDVTYLDLDTMDCADVLAAPGEVIEFLGIDPVSPGRKIRYLAIDEVQGLPDAGRLLKGLFDLDLPLRILATGSSALSLQAGVRESMVGRTATLSLWPLAAPDIPMDERFLRWGGLPEIVLAESDARRQSLLAEMWAAYVDREIEPRARGETVRRFRSFAELLAGQVGQLVNLNELANTLDVSRAWVSRYLDFLERAYLVRVLRPFTANRRSELTKTPKVFFTDLGIRNLLAGSLGETLAPDRPPRMENAVEILLRKAGGRLHFWRTVHGAEVDFIWQHRHDSIPIEVKCSNLSRPAVSRGYRTFLKRYNPAQGLIVNLGLDTVIALGETAVRFVKLEDLAPLLTELREEAGADE